MGHLPSTKTGFGHSMGFTVVVVFAAAVVDVSAFDALPLLPPLEQAEAATAVAASTIMSFAFVPMAADSTPLDAG